VIIRVRRRDFIFGACAAVSGTWSRRSTAATNEVAWLDEVQQPLKSIPKAKLGHFEPLLANEDGSPITTLAQWETRRTEIRAQWMKFLGEMPSRPPVKLTTIGESRADGCRRLLVRYECEPGLSVDGYLLFPVHSGNVKRAALVVLHSTTPETIDEVAGVKGRDSRALGLEFCKQGFIVFCPKCFLWQDAKDYNEAVAKFQKQHPGALGMRKMLNDAQCAVDILASLPEVDPNRIGAAGHSLGAKETLYLAAFDERIKAAVASEGGIGLNFTNWHDPWYLGKAIHEPAFKLNHHQLLALIAPRAFLVLAGESGPSNTSVADGDRTWPFIDAALPVYKLYGKPARIGLYNHRQGHTIPPEALSRMTEWLRTYTSAIH
jgi:hypothetical protein